MYERKDLEIEFCQFPDDLLYDADGFMWLRNESDTKVRIGVTSIYATLAGKVSSVRFKDIREVEKGKGISSIESPTHFGVVKSPVSGQILEVNSALKSNPWLLHDSPYGSGWLAIIEPRQLSEEEKDLSDAKNSRERLLAQINQLRIHCFVAFPDHEMFEIGVECAMVLAKLNDLMTKIPLADVVHLVSDDATTHIEMRRWAAQTGQKIIEVRREDKLYHVIVRKVQEP